MGERPAGQSSRDAESRGDAQVRHDAGMRPDTQLHRGTELRDGLFTDIDSAVEAAAIAFRNLASQSLALREEVITAIRLAMLDAAEDLSQRAWKETGLGRVEDKVLKNRLVARKTP